MTRWVKSVPSRGPSARQDRISVGKVRRNRRFGRRLVLWIAWVRVRCYERDDGGGVRWTKRKVPKATTGVTVPIRV